jgi:hypothetical protein
MVFLIVPVLTTPTIGMVAAAKAALVGRIITVVVVQQAMVLVVVLQGKDGLV